MILQRIVVIHAHMNTSPWDASIIKLKDHYKNDVDISPKLVSRKMKHLQIWVASRGERLALQVYID
jgi:hypothetical protein